MANTAFAWMSRSSEVLPEQQARRTSPLGVALAAEVDRAAEALQKTLVVLRSSPNEAQAAFMVHLGVVQVAALWIADGRASLLNTFRSPGNHEGTPGEQIFRAAWNDLPELVQCEFARIYDRIAPLAAEAAKKKVLSPLKEPRDESR